MEYKDRISSDATTTSSGHSSHCRISTPSLHTHNRSATGNGPEGVENGEDAVGEGEVVSVWDLVVLSAIPALQADSRAIISATMPGTLKDFYDVVLANSSSFLENTLALAGNLGISIGSWKQHEKMGHVRNVEFTKPMEGALSSWGVAFTQCSQSHRFSRHSDELIFETSQTMTNIPYGDCFKVDMRFDVRPATAAPATGSVGMLQVDVSLRIPFSKTCLFKKVIQSQTNKQVVPNYTQFIEGLQEALNEKIKKDQAQVFRLLATPNTAFPGQLRHTATEEAEQHSQHLRQEHRSVGASAASAASPASAAAASGTRDAEAALNRLVHVDPMADVKLIKFEDLPCGSKGGTKEGLKVQLNYSAYTPDAGVLGSPNKTGSSPLDDVCHSLLDQYRKSKWCPGQAGPNLPAAEYTALLRAAVIQWRPSPPPIDTLPARLARAHAVATILAFDPDAHEQLLYCALEANNGVLRELKLQQAAIRSGTFTGVTESDFLQQGVHKEWQSRALRESESLLQQLRKLPEFNGLLEVTVVGGEGIQMRQKGLLFSKSVVTNPYVSVTLEGSGTKGNGPRFTTSVSKSTDAPVWDLQLPALVIGSEMAELLFKVKHCNGSKPGSIDRVVGKCGLRMKGVQPGLTQRITMNLYGSVSGGGCGCFGGAPPPSSGEEEDAAEAGDGKVVYDAAADAVAGISNKQVVGNITLQLRYLQERRSSADASPADTYQSYLQSVLKDTLTKSPIATAESKRCYAGSFKKATVSLVRDPKPQLSSSPSTAPLDVHSMFYMSSGALWNAHKKGLLKALPPAPDEKDFWLQGPVEGPVADLLQNQVLRPYLPFGDAGLGLLLSFGKLFRVRHETQQLIIAQYILESWVNDEAYLKALHTIWKPCLLWYTNSTLTKQEVDGLMGMMGLFLHHAIPALKKHYAVFASEEGVPCFMLLLEMMGWALTWDPKKGTPVPLLEGYLYSAASSRLMKDFRPSVETVAECTRKLVEEVETANEDLHRDIDIQAALPGMDDFALNNCRQRYNVLSDHLDMLFLYQPGGSGQAMTFMWELEAALNEHHALLTKHGMCHVPPSKMQVQVAVETGSPIISAATPSKLLTLWDFEGNISEAIQQWILAGSKDIQEQLERLVAAETWLSTSSFPSVAECALEVQRIINASIEVWMKHTLGGSMHRRQVVGFTITGCLVAILTRYAGMFIHPFTQDLAKRNTLASMLNASDGQTESFLSISRLVRPDLRAIKLPTLSIGSDAPSSIGSFINGKLSGIFAWDKSVAAARPSALSNGSSPTTFHVNPSPRKNKVSFNTFVEPSEVVHGHTKSHVQSMSVSKHKGTKSAGDSLTPFANKDALINVLEAEPGICLSETLCVMRCTLDKLIEDTEELGATLRRALHLGSRDEDESQEEGDTYDGCRQALSPSCGDFVTGAWLELSCNLEVVVSTITTSYSLQYRDSLLGLLLSAYGKRNGEETSIKVLSGLLRAIHDELTCMHSKMGVRAKVMNSLVDCSWRAAMSVLNLIILNQAGFRPLGEKEAETTRDFLDSLIDMYKDLGQQTEPTGIIDASTRMASASSVSALLQALTASTQDLQDIYLAQFVCLAQAHSADGVMIQLSPQQVSLVDTLRLLRQRRKIDPLAAAFVVEQLKGAHAVVTQVIFGLSCNERLIAEARCCLGDSHLTGHMYVTNSCLCFTTMLGSDLKTMTDTTVSTMLDKVITISAGSDPPDSLVLVTSTFEQFTFSAFSSTQERDRLLHLLDREPTNKLSLSTSAASSAVLKRTSRQLVADGVAGDISTPQVVHPATTNFGTPERPSAGCPPRMASVSGDSGGANGHAAGNGIDRQGSHERIASALVGKSLAQTLGTPESAAPSPSNSTMRYSAQLSMTPVMSVPCELVGTLRNKDGLLQVFSTHIEFVGSPSGQQLHFFKLETIELISQKSVFMEGSVLSVQISEEKAPFLFSGMTDALIASLKQSISEQCYRLE